MFISDEVRAKIAALTHELMNLLGDIEIPEAQNAYGLLEEWHDSYRHFDGTDVCLRLDYAIDMTPFSPTQIRGLAPSTDSERTDLFSFPPPVERPLPLLPTNATDSLHHAASVIQALIQGTLVGGTPGQPPSELQIQAAFNRIRYDIDLAESQSKGKRINSSGTED